jgi:hypothetical protein
VERLQALGLDVAVTRESAEVSWIEVASLGLRGYALSEGQSLEAINFELTKPTLNEARRAVVAAAESLGWEVSEDDEEEPDGPE